MEKDAKIYVAGYKGLVGSAIKRKLEEKGYTNLIFSDIDDFDLQRQTETEAFFEKEKPEYVFLAAAKVGGIWANKTYPAEFIYSNLSIEVNVIHAAYKHRVKKLLFLAILGMGLSYCNVPSCVNSVTANYIQCCKSCSS